MNKTIVNWFKNLLGYTTHVNWEGKKYVHHSWTRKGAYEWMKCYPVEGAAWITHTSDLFLVAARNAVERIRHAG